MIEQQHNAPGRWDLATKPGVPTSIRERIENYGHIVITPGVLRGALNRTTLLANSMYTGLVLKHRMRFDLSVRFEGAGLLAWLGYSETRGPYPVLGVTTAATPTWADFVAVSTPASLGFMGMWHPTNDAVNGLELGAVFGTTTFSGARQVVAHRITRTQLGPDGDAQQAGVPSTSIEHRVTPAGVFESGDPTVPGFWRRDPQVVLTRGTSLTEPDMRSLQITDLDVEYDGTTYATEAGAKAGDSSAITYSARVPNAIKNFTGTSGAKWAVIQTLNDDTATAPIRQAAADQLIGFQGESTNIEVAVASHPTFAEFCEPGDFVWIHDPDTGLTDTGNQITFGGRRINPAKVRVYGARWPVMEGRGVYYASNDWSTIIDLAPHMQWEAGDIKLEVGSPLRSTTQITDTPRQI